MTLELQKFSEDSTFVQQANANLIARAAKGQMQPNVVTLEVGQSLEGILVGPGAPVETHDKITGEEKSIPSFVFENDVGVRVALMASYQLAKQLPDLIGRRVLIIRGETKRSGAKQINQYIVSDVTDVKSK